MDDNDNLFGSADDDINSFNENSDEYDPDNANNNSDSDPLFSEEVELDRDLGDLSFSPPPSPSKVRPSADYRNEAIANDAALIAGDDDNEEDDDDDAKIAKNSSSLMDSLLEGLDDESQNEDDALFGIGDEDDDEDEEEEQDLRAKGGQASTDSRSIANVNVNDEDNYLHMDPLRAGAGRDMEYAAPSPAAASASASASANANANASANASSSSSSSRRPTTAVLPTKKNNQFVATLRPNPSAGMHVPQGADTAADAGQIIIISAPESIQPAAPPLFSTVAVTNPTFVKEGGAGLMGGFWPGQGGFWSFSVTCSRAGNGQSTTVNRRFRHFVALEDRLRLDLPGAILPPRPDKHANTTVNADNRAFALARTRELQIYLSALIQHPWAGASDVLDFFLTFVDDVGAAWPEVSGSALTRLTVGVPKTWDRLLGGVQSEWEAGGGAGAAASVSSPSRSRMMMGQSMAESTFVNANSAAAAGSRSSYYEGAAESMWVGNAGSVGAAMGTHSPTPSASTLTEEAGDFLTLENLEAARLTQVCQAVPKMEGAMILLHQFCEVTGSMGMEAAKLGKDIAKLDRPLGITWDTMGLALLRSARRSKRCVAEIRAALVPFGNEFKMVRMERAAFADRRAVILKRNNLRQDATMKANMLHQYRHGGYMTTQSGPPTSMERLQMDAHEADQKANEATKEAQDVGLRIQAEVGRLRTARRKQWVAAMKIMAGSMQVSHEEQLAQWTIAKKNLSASVE